MASRQFSCSKCGREFSVPQAALDKYPGWTPAQCMACRDAKGGGQRKRPARKAPSRGGGRSASGAAGELLLTPAEVLERFTGGPDHGVFTDGACSGNPGPGGWGMVWVDHGEILAERNGFDPQTTNNRMELMALINAFELLPEDAEVTVFTDSQLCVNTLTDWAHKWKARGWKKKSGPVKNLELVQRAFALVQAHPKVELRWIKAHAGSRWNEYADSLATAFMRSDS